MTNKMESVHKKKGDEQRRDFAEILRCEIFKPSTRLNENRYIISYACTEPGPQMHYNPETFVHAHCFKSNKIHIRKSMVESKNRNMKRRYTITPTLGRK